MVKKIMTGLAISVGAGLAMSVTNLAVRKESRKTGWHPAAPAEGTLTPVTIRVNTAIPRTELARISDNNAKTAEMEEPMAPETRPERAAELAEIRVMIEALESRTNEALSAVNRRIDDLQNHLPRFIDVKVTSRIREVEERLRTEFQDEQSRTLDAFLKMLDQRVLPRIALVEEAAGVQGEEIGRMRTRIEKTDETLGRVLDRVEKVVDSINTFPDYNTSHVTEINKKAVA